MTAMFPPGWPAFDKCYTDSVAIEVDESHGMKRVEIMCAKCGGHLGHVFHGEQAAFAKEILDEFASSPMCGP